MASALSMHFENLAIVQCSGDKHITRAHKCNFNSFRCLLERHFLKLVKCFVHWIYNFVLGFWCPISVKYLLKIYTLFEYFRRYCSYTVFHVLLQSSDWSKLLEYIDRNMYYIQYSRATVFIELVTSKNLVQMGIWWN